MAVRFSFVVIRIRKKKTKKTELPLAADGESENKNMLCFSERSNVTNGETMSDEEKRVERIEMDLFLF